MATSCDNVEWGGIDVSLESPADVRRVDTVQVVAEPEAPPPRPEGPLLLAGTREGTQIRLAPVVELLSEGPASLATPGDSAAYRSLLERLAVGTQWTLFAEGVRVGSVTVDETATSPELCGLDRVLVGVPELLASASSAERFLALPAGAPDTWDFGEYAAPDHDYGQRVALLRMAGEALPRLGARWPTGGMLPNRRDMQAFRVAGASGPSAAATFVVDDALDTSPAPETSYAVFMMVEEGAEGFRETYVWHRSAAQGKAAPRFFEHLDWDRDGREEALLEVFGEDERGFAALERTPDGTWTDVWRSACTDPVEATGG